MADATKTEQPAAAPAPETAATPSAAATLGSATYEIIRQRCRDLTLARATPDLIYDQMIGMGCARRLTFSWGGNPGVGSLHRFRDAIENGWPPIRFVPASMRT